MGDAGKPPELSRVKSYQWPAGHVAHLTDSQITALQRFKDLSQDKGYYTPGDGRSPPSHDDETLLRYLRARKFVSQEAFGQFKDTEDWRKENKLDTLYETIDVEEYDETRRLYPQWTGRRDKRGIPLYVFEIANVDAKAVSAYSSSKDRKNQSTNTKVAWKLLKLFALYENLCRFVLPLCSVIPDRASPETPISQSNNIVDLSNVGFSKMWSLRNHMSDASRLATAHYPETLDRIFVIGAPSFFPTLWGWAQRWFDPITVSKIFILGQKDTTSTLEKFVNIEDIPKKYGGKLDWKFGDRPFLDPGIANAIRWRSEVEEKGHKTFPLGPMKLQYDEQGDLVLQEIGTEGGKPRTRVIGSLHPEANVARLALSPGRVLSAQNPNATTAAAATAPVAVAAAETHPPTEPAAKSATEPATEPIVTPPAPPTTRPTMSSDADLNVGKTPDALSQPASRTGAYTVPWQDDSNNISSPPPAARQGTSSTRFEQQAGTHAEGQLADGTPELRTHGGSGDHPAVMDPNTVGQAPKEHPLPEAEEGGAGVLEQAKELAGQAVEQAKNLPGVVMSAVGYGAKEEKTEEVVRKEDPEVDGMAAGNVEEFLRSQHGSKPAQNAAE
ncbi:CRAL-TRIO domain-containing protein [Neohortaea acidophila]|uniref:CRAL-TRIO domain-containing protein n=1 Tax=Neohortaea acidophila TaxID=245834 RepID=A0A6A6PP31_9PEZI|nr:CRAL-TRIO domain-containing protein [Neohortaea acidophila]KAF2481848.1 CRAL-TRIO domain-containing protein [Neohortaea acidophila]